MPIYVRNNDYFEVIDNTEDIDEQLKEELEMAFPIRFLCKDDCRGLCQRCGKNLNEGECGCNTKEIDPRLAPLKDLLLKMQNENNK